MAWYNVVQNVRKLFPGQSVYGGTIRPPAEPQMKYVDAYKKVEVVNRGVNMIVDDSAGIPVKIGGEVPVEKVANGVRAKTVHTLLNYRPNPFQDISTFKRNLITDFLLDGNMFIYWDGSHLYHMAADKTTIVASEKRYIEKYTFNAGASTLEFSPNEVIHVKENSFETIFRGMSRLRPAERTMKLMLSMRTFQDNFFNNGAVPGLVLKSPNTLSDKVKERMIAAWQQKYNPRMGGGSPLILDGGLDLDQLSDVSFKDLGFSESINDNEKIILKALGIPPLLLDSGNNANIRPNMRLYYLETILPIVRKLNWALERFFGFAVVEDVTNIPALQPELNEAANYYSTLVNSGIISPNEAREALGHEKMEGFDEIRIPANIAGSAVNPSEGGRPSQEEE